MEEMKENRGEKEVAEEMMPNSDRRKRDWM